MHPLVASTYLALSGIPLIGPMCIPILNQEVLSNKGEKPFELAGYPSLPQHEMLLGTLTTKKAPAR